GSTPCAVYRRADRKADLVDQAGPQKRAVRFAAAFEQQALDPQLAVQDVQRERQIQLPFAGKDVGDAVAAQPRQMRVGDLFGQHHDDRVAADIRATPGDLAASVESDAVSWDVAPNEPGFAREDLARVIRIGIFLGVFAAGDAADQPGAIAELLVDT